MKSIKKIIIDSIDQSAEVLTDIRITRKNGRDYGLERNRTKEIVDRLHPDSLDLEVTEIIDVTPDAKTFRLASRTGYLPPFQAGQYINIFAEIEGVRTSRPYSISSSPRQRGFYEITVARIPSGFVTEYFLNEVKVGDTFEANGPAGVFHFNPVFHSKKQVFLAGGSGITPFRSMTQEILNADLDREIHLIYGVRTPEAAFFADEFEDMARRHPNFTYTIVVSEPEPGYQGKTGFITGECIKDIVGSLEDKTFYICGPPVMNDFCVSALEKEQVPSRMIRREMFGARQDIQNEPGWPSELTGEESFTMKVSGGSLAEPREIKALSRESVLTSLERAGIPMTVCCRSGECGLCRVQLLSGKVFMPRGVLTRHADEKFGYIHSCKAYPIGDLEVMIP